VPVVAPVYWVVGLVSSIKEPGGFSTGPSILVHFPSPEAGRSASNVNVVSSQRNWSAPAAAVSAGENMVTNIVSAVEGQVGSSIT